MKVQINRIWPRILSVVAITALVLGVVPLPALSSQVASAASCPCTLWPSTTTPTVVDNSDSATVELGVKFSVDTTGTVSGVRFFKSSNNTGTHTGSLWSSTGTQLATATFTSESTSGWQQVHFATPVAVTAGTTYVASYLAPAGHYSSNSNYFANAYDNSPLHVPSSATAGGNGVYKYGGGFPNSTYNSTNYWVDVVYSTGTAPACANAIACENQLPGNPKSDWDIGQTAGDPSIQGFATDISTNAGQSVHFKINTPSTNYQIKIFRVGYYGGNGARQVDTISPTATLPQTQPACLTDSATGLIDCGNWSESAVWNAPSTAVSGVYIALLKRLDATSGSGVSQALFVIRNDASTSDLLYQTSDTTWGAAYNDYGGNSLYGGTNANSSDGRAFKVSYNRPLNTRGNQYERTNFFANEYPMIRWLESNGYDMSYTTGVDSDRQAPAVIEQHKTFISSGHDEYWSKTQRDNVTAARDAGVNLAFFSGNQVFWKTRWETSIDASGTSHRTLVTYKETKVDAKLDPNSEWTGTWRDNRLSPPYDGGVPENGLTGNLDTVNCCGNYSINVPAADGQMRFWRGTSVASLAAGTIATLTPGVIGFEWDEDIDNGSRPAGQIDLSTSPETGVSRLDAYGNDGGPGTTATHSLTLYKAPSGALVFGAGTVRWSWGLDANHDDGTSTADPVMQQATVNLLADMSAQPTTLQTGLAAATKSTDTTAPTSVITSPTTGADIPSGTPITVTGSATDTGGHVGGVEVSVDGGTTWHPASGRSSWNYTTSVAKGGNLVIKSRATDDSGNIETPSAGITATSICPCQIWGNTVTPTTVSANDITSAELGVKFRADQTGTVSGIRFYKGSGNTGTHIGNLWSSTGTLLGTATFSGESATGWQQVSFATPIAVSANTTYVASYFAPAGHYAADSTYFGSKGADSAPLHALANGVDGPNGVFAYGASSAFPTSTFNATNYWVDIIYTGTPPTAPAGLTATAPSYNQANLSWTASTDSVGIAKYEIFRDGAQTPVGQTTGTSFSDTQLAPLTNYSYVVKAVDATGNVSAASNTATVTTPAAASN